MKREEVSIIGAGRVGTALALLLHRRGYTIAAVASKTLASARNCARLVSSPLATTDPIEAARAGEIIFITTPDRAIRKVCDKIAGGRGFGKGNLVIHTSGFLDSEELLTARERGALTLSMHPVQSFADSQSALDQLPGSYFGLEGEEEALNRGKRLVRDLRGRAVVIPKGAKPLYHAAACVASNYLVGLAHLSLELYGRAGIPKKEALKMLLPLVKGTLANMERTSIPSALTGPIERGEADVLRGQISSIKDKAPELLGTFVELARYTIQVASDRGRLKAKRARELEELLPNKRKLIR